MRKILSVLLILTLVGLALGLLLSFVVFLITGWLIWMITWRFQSGFFESPRYRKWRIYGGYNIKMIDERVTKEIASRRRGSILTALFFFVIGGLYMIVGFVGFLLEMG